jgi:histidine triad (HIT) family protein
MLKNDCIFCKIINKEIASNFVYEDENVIAINDLNPQAKVHLLVIPKIHVESLKDVKDEKIMTGVFKGIQNVTEQLEITDFQTVINTGKDAGQTVFHLHAHIMSNK